MTVQVGPAEPGEIAVGIWAVVPQEKDSVSHNIFARILDPDVIVGGSDILVSILLEPLRSIVGEDDERSSGLNAGSIHIHIQRQLQPDESLHGSEGNSRPCTALSGARNRCGMWNGCREQSHGG